MKHKTKITLLLSALALTLFADRLLWANAPNLLTYQGRLQESGAAVTGARSVEIAVCDAFTAGTCYATGVQGVSVVSGLFRSTFTLPGSVDLSVGNWFLEIRVGPSGGGVTTLSPREQLTSAPYAVHAGTAASVSAANVSGGVLGNDVVASEYYRKPALRHTRTLVAYNAADAVKDSQCTGELGGNYTAAKLSEVAMISAGFVGTGSLASVIGAEFNVREDPAKSYTTLGSAVIVGMGNAGTGMRTVTGGTYPISCISVNAALRFTTTLVPFTASDGTKDGQCVAEFGSAYMAANMLDAISVGRGRTVGDTGGPALSLSDSSFNVAGNTTHSWKSAITPSMTTVAASIDGTPGGTYRVACIRK